jgi:hypothetical protein
MSTKRWLDEASDADGFERSLLASGLDADPPPRAEEEVWQRVLTAVVPPIGPGPGAGAPGALAAAKGATLTTLGKGFLLGVAASVAVAGAERVMTPRRASTLEPSASVRPAISGLSIGALAADPDFRRAPTAMASSGASEVLGPRSSQALGASVRPALSSRAAPPRSPESAPVLVEPPSGVAAQGSVAAFPLTEAPASVPKSRLDEEALLLRRARAEVRSGALAAAFATLEASREKFSAPELYQEREALLIELLHRSGQSERARERARAFLRRFPESPHAAAVRAFADSPR